MFEGGLALLLLDAETGGGGSIAAAFVFFGGGAGFFVLAKMRSRGCDADGTFGAGRRRSVEGGGRGKVGLKGEIGLERSLIDVD